MNARVNSPHSMVISTEVPDPASLPPNCSTSTRSHLPTLSTTWTDDAEEDHNCSMGTNSAAISATASRISMV